MIDEFVANEDDAKERLSKDFAVNELFKDWLGSFRIYQPTDYFLKESKEDDVELEYNTLSELDFLFSTLEIFGLPKDYINGRGHHANWAKERNNADSKKKGKKKKAAPKSSAVAKLAAKAGVNVQVVEVRPTFFDLVPFQKAFRKFIACGGEARSMIRSMFIERAKDVRHVFLDKYKELSFKKVMDVHEFAAALQQAGLPLDGIIAESLGSMLLCFGNIKVDAH